ncbi:unnamed protein product [Coffea canephora]|uniref:Uncharacterized protein n=1 Tax=Coffea canephora TaxID=49390 RepID=A0A068TW20_COFCA|nr:unnamed protein product [Coffea canephora]
MGIESVEKFVVEKLKELWQAMENLWGQFLEWFDKIFPPETRGEKLHHWLQIALPIAIAGVVLSLLLYCCYKCCCKCGGGRRVKMMKAPGRNCTMARPAFEANPKSYFRNLRAHPGDQLC